MLDGLGFPWENTVSEDWEKAFSHLRAYDERVGDCRVPYKHVENGFKLGKWVSTQRYNQANLSEEIGKGLMYSDLFGVHRRTDGKKLFRRALLASPQARRPRASSRH